MSPNPTDRNIQTLCLAVIATAVATYMVYWLRPVLVPFVVALLVVSGVTPILEVMERTLRVSRLVASVIAFVAGLFVLGILCICLWISVQQIREEGKAYQSRVSQLLGVVQDWIPQKLVNSSENVEEPRTEQANGNDAPDKQDAGTEAGKNNSLQDEDAQLADDDRDTSLDVALDATTPQPDLLDASRGSTSNPEPGGRPTANALSPPQLGQPGTSMTTFDPAYVDSLRNAADSFVGYALTTISAELFQIFSTSIVVLIYVFFILLGSAETQAIAHLKAVDQQVRSYLFLKTIISILTGFCFGAVLWAFGVPMSLTFGVLAFLLNYIPNIGPVVASLLPIPFILLAPEGGAIWMASAISVSMAVQVVSGSVIEPKLMGDASDLHPVVILLALMFWGMMWGITGMFLATPITAGLKIVLEGNSSTKRIAAIMAGRLG